MLSARNIFKMCIAHFSLRRRESFGTSLTKQEQQQQGQSLTRTKDCSLSLRRPRHERTEQVVDVDHIANGTISLLDHGSVSIPRPGHLGQVREQ
jgi:hypothetical protein